jgi:hypothetical protein
MMWRCHPTASVIRPKDGFCWTDGELALPPTLFAYVNGALALTVVVNRQLTEPKPAARARLIAIS